MDQSLQAATEIIDALTPLIDALKPSSDFEIGVVNINRLIVSHLKALEVKYHDLKQLSHRSLGAMDSSMTELTTAVVKSEQYNRRDTVTVLGMPQLDDEDHDKLAKKVATQLSCSGETVTPGDFSAIHRNGKPKKTTAGKIIPPSITVKFSRVSKKDTILRGYKNFDHTKKKPRDVKVFQSLSPHYAALRRKIVGFFDTSNSAGNYNKELKWVTYQSPTAGLVVKLNSDEYMRDIHIWDDFLDRFAAVTK
jgi:translation initiation factor 1 (eIF-1/SUI1)